jgi:hypothetical protein
MVEKQQFGGCLRGRLLLVERAGKWVNWAPGATLSVGSGASIGLDIISITIIYNEYRVTYLDIHYRHSHSFSRKKAMQPYMDLNGDSGVATYEVGQDSITIQFSRGGTYLYTNSVPGAMHVAEMKRLAETGDGLNTYINKYVRKNYAAKLS